MASDQGDTDRRSINASFGREGSVRSDDADDDRRSLSIYNSEESGQKQGLFGSSTLKRRPAKGAPRKKATPGGHASAAGLFQKLR